MMLSGTTDATESGRKWRPSVAAILAVLVSAWAVWIFLSYFGHTFQKLGLESFRDLTRMGADSFWGRLTSWRFLIGDNPATIDWQLKPVIVATVALALLVMFVCVGCGRSLLRALGLLGDPQTPGASCIAYALGLGIVIILMLLLGYARLIYHETIWMMLGVLGTIAIRSYVRDWRDRGRASPEQAECPPGARPTGIVAPSSQRFGTGETPVPQVLPERAPRSLWRRLGSVLITAYIIMLLLQYFVSALAPEHSFDGLNVYLYFGRVYNEEHRILEICPMRTNASLYSMLLCSFSLNVYGAGVAKLLIFGAALAALRLVQVVTDRFAGAGAGRWAALILLTVPAFTETATVVMSDCQMMFFTLCMVTSAVYLLTTRNWRWAYVTAIMAGVAAGLKYHGVMAAALLVGVLVVVWSVVALRRRFGSSATESAILPFRVRPLLVASAIFLAIGSPQYVRNYLWLGDPIFPFLYKYLPSTVMSAEEEEALLRSNLNLSMHFADGVLDTIRLPWRVTMEGHHIQTPIGPVFLMALPLVLLSRRWEIGVVVFAIFAVLWALLWQKTSVIGRHFPAAAATLAVLCAFMRARFATVSLATRLSAGLMAAIWTVSAFLSMPAFANHWFPGWCLAVREVPLAVVFGRQTEADYLFHRVRALPMAQLINELDLPRRTRMVCVPTGHVVPFLTNCRMGDWDLFHAVFARPNDPEATFESCRREEVEYIVWSYRGNPYPHWSLFKPNSQFRRKYLTRVGDTDGMVLFKVDAKADADQPPARYLTEEIACALLKPAGPTELRFTRGHLCVGKPAWGLELHANNDYSIPLTIPPNGRLETAFVFDDRAAAHSRKGLAVTLILTSADGVDSTLFSQTFLPNERSPDGVERAFDLSPFANSEVTLRISVGPGSSRVPGLDRILLKKLTLACGSHRRFGSSGQRRKIVRPHPPTTAPALVASTCRVEWHMLNMLSSEGAPSSKRRLRVLPCVR